ncbi:sensor histidine kinase [Oxalobacteraceae bacterium R-40]|uniref:Sensor histidine kinase n=1 Tax=Keguizhuia sedimenti TaxID=3064264 RepID=A0ABU1BSR8_9BURK|nr:sensor histidine kinase [Oxalobacteraceae bacterium R-40]
MIADVLLGLSYLSISSALAYFAYKRLEAGIKGIALAIAMLIFIGGIIQFFAGAGNWRLAPEWRIAQYAISGLVFIAALLSWPLVRLLLEMSDRNTGRLENMIAKLRHEVAERARAEVELQKSQELLRQLAAYQEQVKEDERKRIAREIHDDLGQNLMALRIDMSILQSRAGNNPLINEKVVHAMHHIDNTIKAVRTIINNLRPSVLDLGLHAAIEWQVNEFSRRTGIECKITKDDTATEFELDDQRATALFRILQESLTNVARHAQATCVDIELQRNDDTFIMRIRDNGVGIYPGCRRKPNSFGLLGIGERISMLGGEFSVDSGPGKGTLLSISIPIEKEVAAEIW